MCPTCIDVPRRMLTVYFEVKTQRIASSGTDEVRDGGPHGITNPPSILIRADEVIE
jgi:hypothetical protein